MIKGLGMVSIELICYNDVLSNSSPRNGGLGRIRVVDSEKE